jgi:hypothetical protein
MMHPKLQLLSISALLAIATPSFAQKVCVFDPLGTQGEIYSFMKDYAVVAKQWGADITLKPYADDEKASDDFKQGKCDALYTTGIRTRQFNNFSGSIDSAGGVPDEKTARIILTLMASPKIAPLMESQDTEIAGISALGFAYPMTNDRTINTMAKMSGKTFGVLEYDTAQRVIVDKVGATPVVVTLSTIGPMFNSGKITIVDLPALAFKALDISKGMGTKGAIARYPVAYLTNQLVIHPAKFPDGYGQKSRTWYGSQMDRQFKTVAKIESSIDARYWMEIPALDKVNYNKLLRQGRISMANDGAYSKRMMSILKKIRCMQDPGSYECALKDE